MAGDDGPPASSSGVRYPSPAKNTRPFSFSPSATTAPKDAKRSSGTCESHKTGEDHAVTAVRRLGEQIRLNGSQSPQ